MVEVDFDFEIVERFLEFGMEGFLFKNTTAKQQVQNPIPTLER